MGKAKPFISQVNLAATQFDQTLAFYRLLGLDLPDPAAEPPGVLHVEADVASGARFALDNEHLARLYNAARRDGSDRNSVLVCIEFADRTEIDAADARLTAAGHEGLCRFAWRWAMPQPSSTRPLPAQAGLLSVLRWR